TSTKPGATMRPPASILSRAGPERAPIAAIRPSRSPTSARRAGAPVPSTNVAPEIRTSSMGPPSPRGSRPGGYAGSIRRSIRYARAVAAPPSAQGMQVEPARDGREGVAAGFDADALRARYREEREKRLRADGNDQYRELAGAFAHLADDPWALPAA